jgi:hypothetical protein
MQQTTASAHNAAKQSRQSAPRSAASRGCLREDQNGPDCYSPLLAPCPAHIPAGACPKSILCGTRLSACHEPMDAAQLGRVRNLSAISFHPNGFRQRSGSLPVPRQGCLGMPCRAAKKQRTARQYPLHHPPPSGSEQTRSFPPHPLPAQHFRVEHDAGRAAYLPPLPSLAPSDTCHSSRHAVCLAPVFGYRCYDGLPDKEIRRRPCCCHHL